MMGRDGLTPEIESDITTEVTVAGLRLLVRPIRPTDKELLQTGFGAMSAESRAQRFHGSVSQLSPSTLRYFTEIDYVNHFAVVVLDLETDLTGVGFGRYIRIRDRPDAAEIALAVIDCYQGRGIGTVVVDALTATALSAGIDSFVVSVRLDNLPMRALLGVGTGGPPPDNAGVLTYECDLRSQDAARQSRPMYRAFRGAAAEAASHRTASGG